MSLPIVHLTGKPYEQGQQHGAQLKERVARNVAVYFERFEREVGLSRQEVLTRAAKSAGAIAEQNADYFDAMQGVADGSGFSLEEIAALNARYEILYYQFGKNAMAELVDGCTAFALRPDATDTHHLYLGQNWDWIPDVAGAVLHTTEPDGLETLAFTEAGIVGAKIGFNSHGVGLCITGMTTTEDDWSRLKKPMHVRCYEILRQTNFDNAVRVVTDTSRSCTTNFLIAQTPDKIADIEAAPDKIRRLEPDARGVLVHTNHFLDPAQTGVVEPPNPRRPYSVARRDRMGELLASHSPVTIDAIQTYVKDTVNDPFGICRHRNPEEPPEMHYTTVTSIVMDLDARVMHLTDGPPDMSDWQTVSLT